MSETAVAAPASGYPTQFDIEYPEQLSRLLIFVKWLLVIPHLLILSVLAFVQYVIIIFAFFTVLFTKKYPEGLFTISVGVMRWTQNANAYMLLMRDEYPPFSWEPDEYPVTLEIDYPEELTRWAPLYKWLLAIPNLIVFMIVSLVAYFLIWIAWFAILFTGKFPRGLFDFVVGTQRWGVRLNVYMYLMRDEYPPFSLK